MICLVLSTAPDLETARKLAGLLLENRLAACVSLLPGIESHYVWEKTKECSPETLLLIKTTTKNWALLRDFLRENHPYDCPEIVEIPAAGVLEAYAQWVAASVLP